MFKSTAGLTDKNKHEQTPVQLCDERWVKAAVAGGLWAAFEIIIGSFLHNLRIPFAGSILSVFAVMLMVAFYRLWPVKGLVWRAGLICALMKSISPSALILGPMTGIMTEALLLEFTIRVLGSNKAAYITGGILGVSSALIHKVISLLILYGTDIFNVYLNIYRFAVKQIGIADADPRAAVLILAGVYIAGGVFAAFIGFSIPLESDDKHGELPAMPDKPVQSTPFELSAHHYSLPFLAGHLLSVPLLILLIVNASLLISVAVIAIWAVFLVLKYPGVFRRFRKPVLWMQFLIILLIASFFWEGNCSYLICFSPEGFRAGVAMLLRAVVVIMAFSAFSVEVRNPLVKAFLEKRGLQNLYMAITIAFSALPYMIGQIPEARILIGHPRKAIAGSLLSAQRWLDRMKS